MNYFQLIRNYSRYLLFAVTHAFFSGVGQTIVLSFFIPSIRSHFGMQNLEFGYFYSFATLVAALSLPYAGKQIDHINLRTYSSAIGLILVSACLIIAISPNLLVLFIGFVCIRLSGQSLMGHISSTTMARYFGRLRGKALGLATQGHPLGEAVFPLMITQLLALFSWRVSYALLAGFVCFVFFPITRMLVKKDDPFIHPTTTREKESINEKEVHFRRSEVLKTPFFYFVIPLAILPPFIATGMFLHQSNLGELQGWSVEWLATCVLFFSMFRILGSLIGGPLIDRFSAKQLFPYHLIPMAFSLTTLFIGKHPLVGALYYSLFGLSIGLEMNLKSALWAEVYGTRYLGSIRSMTLTVVIFSTAIAPVLFGWFFDSGRPLSQLIWICFLAVVAATLLAFFAPHPKKKGGT